MHGLMSLLKPLGRRNKWGAISPVARLVKLRETDIRYDTWGSLLPQMSFKPQRLLMCLGSHGPLLTSDFNGGEGVDIFWRNYPLLLFLPS